MERIIGSGDGGGGVLRKEKGKEADSRGLNATSGPLLPHSTSGLCFSSSALLGSVPSVSSHRFSQTSGNTGQIGLEQPWFTTTLAGHDELLGTVHGLPPGVLC